MCTNIIFVYRDNNINYIQLITEICYELEIKTLNMLCSFYPHYKTLLKNVFVWKFEYI